MYLLLLAACTGEKLYKPAITETSFEPCTVDDIAIPLTYTQVAPVEFVQDNVGVVHIYAQNDADLFFAAGYEQGRQRLYQIDRARHATRGTLASLAGSGEVETDQIARTFNFLELGCRTLKYQAELRPDDIGLGVAFTAGLNAFVNDVAGGKAQAPTDFGQDTLSYVPEPFTVVDVTAMGKRINLGYSSQLDFDLLVSISDNLVSDFETFPIWMPGRPSYIVDGEGELASYASSTGSPTPVGNIDIPGGFAGRLNRLGREVGEGRASNNWAINAAFTSNGKPMMANDPHADVDNPAKVITWHLNSADAGGNFDVAGFSFPGVPGVHMGHNRVINWAATNNFADAMDIFDVNIVDGYADIGGKQVPVYVRDEVISVRQSDGSFVEESFPVTDIPGFGVILPAVLMPIEKTVFADGEVLVAWAGFDTDTTELFQFLDFDRSTSLDATQAAVALEGVGQQNWVFADALDIRYQTHGNLPLRGDGDPRRISNAATPGAFWEGGYLDDALFPALDGSQDYIYSANNPPFNHVEDNDPTNDAFYYGSYFDPGYRAGRIGDLLAELTARGNVSLDDMISLQADVGSTIAYEMVPLLVAAAAKVETDESLAEFRGRTDLIDAVSRLEAWDGNMSKSSEEGALFHTWQVMLQERNLGGDMGVLFDAIAEASPVFMAKTNTLAYTLAIDALTDGKGDRNMLYSLDDAMAWIEEIRVNKGLDRVTWSDIHTIEIGSHWIDNVVIPYDGDESTINVADCVSWIEGELQEPCASHNGSIYRAVASFGDDNQPELYFSVPYGGVGGTTDWEEHRYEYLNFRKSEVDAAAATRWTLGL